MFAHAGQIGLDGSVLGSDCAQAQPRSFPGARPGPAGQLHAGCMEARMLDLVGVRQEVAGASYKSVVADCSLEDSVEVLHFRDCNVRNCFSDQCYLHCVRDGVSSI